MKLIGIKQITEIGKRPVYDIHHKLGNKNFYDEHPNLVVEDLVISNCSKHAGGVAITHNAKNNLPIIKAGGNLQTPWTEGLNYRHLEAFGFLKFDILALGTLRMFENCIRRIIQKEQGIKNPSFKQIKQWYYKNLHPDNNNLDDEKVYKHIFWDKHYTGIFQFVQPNVQKFAQQMKPQSITDLAVITSIHRPAPLAMSVDKEFLKYRKNPDKIQYKHPLLQEVLGDTSGFIIFQEQLQLIYNKLAGTPLDETDAIRKAFTKKDLSNKEKQKKEIQRLKEDFIQKCYDVNGIDEETSSNIFEEMKIYSSYNFNKSHAVAYCIVSYMCAWMLTYYPDEWVATYIDYCIKDKGKVAGKDDPKSVAMGEAKKLGYKIGKPDINHSEREFIVQGTKLIPSFAALKHVGSAVLDEIHSYRPYTSIEDLLFNPNDTWRHTKLNKRALSTLIKLEALDSTGIVGPTANTGLKNYRQLHYVVIENYDKLKRAVSRKKNKTHKQLLHDLIQEAQELEDWGLEEKVQHAKELAGTVDPNLLLTPDIVDFLSRSNLRSVDEWSNEFVPYWAIVESCNVATTKNGKKYLRAKICGESGVPQNCFVWGFNPKKHNKFTDYMLMLAKFKKNEFGMSAFFNSVETIYEKNDSNKNG